MSLDSTPKKGTEEKSLAHKPVKHSQETKKYHHSKVQKQKCIGFKFAYLHNYNHSSSSGFKFDRIIPTNYHQIKACRGHMGNYIHVRWFFPSFFWVFFCFFSFGLLDPSLTTNNLLVKQSFLPINSYKHESNILVEHEHNLSESSIRI